MATSGDGGNAKFAIIGVVLLLGASGVIWYLMHGSATSPPPVRPSLVAMRDAGPATPTGPTVGVQIQLPLEEPDAGSDDAGAPVDGGRHIHYVYRYVSACPGTVDAPRVAAVVRQNYGGLRECYNRQLRINPMLRGNVTAEWVINPNGSVGQINTSGAVSRDHVFKTCFDTSLSHMRFPTPRGGCAMFQQSFTFTPGE